MPMPMLRSPWCRAVAPLALGAALAAQPATVNAPVAPEAIYVGSGGASPGVSVIDLNGFGQGTGEVASSRFPLNPNVGMPGVTPALSPGTSPLDAGSAGALTLTRDHLGGTRLGPADLGGVGDLQLGQPLDLVWNNDDVNRNAGSQNQVNPATLAVQAGNTISVAPHPNPPRLVFPPPNPARGIEAEEPTVTSSIGPPGAITTTAPPCVPSAVNVLLPGNPFAAGGAGLGIFGAVFPGVFYGPQPPPPVPPPPPAFCPFTSRQQIGHFLYALDRDCDEVVVLNSNRFTVLARIPLPDPHSMAMSPNLKWLAVSNRAPGTVSIVDADPLSATFHQVIAVTAVGRGPTGLAWQPDGDDLLVCNTADGTVSILEPGAFAVRRTISRLLDAPFEVAVTSRQVNTGFFTHTYFAYFLNANGTVAVFESGPPSLGPDDAVALARFSGAAAILADPSAPTSAVWVAHRDDAGLGQVSQLALTSSPAGAGRTDVRKQWSVTARIGGLFPSTPVRSRLSGNFIADLAFDDVRNRGAWPDFPSPYHAVPPARHSSKSHVKSVSGNPQVATVPSLLFVALADTGRVDVLELASGQVLASLPAPGVTSLCHYWRQ